MPVLLLAETGTGKELLARAIHGASARRDRPFVAINCGALSPHLLESELFGYAPGAFTDARREGHEGKVGAARGGTLFLDEVVEMPGPLQSLLLRVLEDGTYYRVGESVPRQADVRLICATCRDLPRMVEEGSFRQDLFYRIAGACLTLPPVRERSDVRSLVVEVLRSLGEQDRGPAPRPADALDWMTAQSWPGNVRQIKTALQYGATLAEGAEIRCEHLPPMLVHRPSALARPSAEEPVAAAPGFTSFRDNVLLEFSGLDLFAITGPTGAGKSSLIDAIVFALYGQVPRVGDDYKQLISHGAERLSVLLEFGVGQERYRIARTARPDRPSQQRLERITPGGAEPIADRAREIRTEVDRILGLDYDGFTRSVVLPQGQFDAFLKGEPRERRKILVALLSLSVYERMQQLANQRSSAARTEAEFIRRQLETDFGNAIREALEQKKDDLEAAAGLAPQAEAALAYRTVSFYGNTS